MNPFQEQKLIRQTFVLGTKINRIDILLYFTLHFTLFILHIHWQVIARNENSKSKSHMREITHSEFTKDDSWVKKGNIYVNFLTHSMSLQNQPPQIGVCLLSILSQSSLKVICFFPCLFYDCVYICLKKPSNNVMKLEFVCMWFFGLIISYLYKGEQLLRERMR